ncbi:MAG: hypothetical protein VYE68_08635 [Acidobacteriota bacterium]|nr:hypothetical protein [Acidobacteriota bacterium]
MGTLSRTRSICLVGVAMLVAGSSASAQNGQVWYDVDIVQVRPDKLDDFNELYQEEINPALRRAGVPWRSAWNTGAFGETYERMLITPMAGFADLDTGGPLGQALSPRDLDRVLGKLREYTASRQSYAVLYRDDLSVESDDVSGLPIARMTNLEIATGRAAEFEAFLQSNLENFRAQGVIFGVYQRQFGPGPVVWQIVENLHSYAELARGGILRAFREDEEARALSSLTGVITRVERTVLEYDASLSYRGEGTTTEQ